MLEQTPPTHRPALGPARVCRAKSLSPNPSKPSLDHRWSHPQLDLTLQVSLRNNVGSSADRPQLPQASTPSAAVSARLSPGR